MTEEKKIDLQYKSPQLPGKGPVISTWEAKEALGRGSFRRTKHQGRTGKPTEWTAAKRIDRKIDHRGNISLKDKAAIDYLSSKKIPPFAIKAFQELEGYSPTRIQQLFDLGKLAFIGGKLRDK